MRYSSYKSFQPLQLRLSSQSETAPSDFPRVLQSSSPRVGNGLEHSLHLHRPHQYIMRGRHQIFDRDLLYINPSYVLVRQFSLAKFLNRVQINKFPSRIRVYIYVVRSEL